MNSASRRRKPRLTTSAMIASIAGEASATEPAPFGHALVELAEGAAGDRRHDRRPRQVHRPAHLSRSSIPDRFYQMGMAEQLLMVGGRRPGA